jgi:D-3-phosphoglycerate dehydrogenase
MRILCAGDEFISAAMFVEALKAELGDGHEYITDDSGWPTEPFHENAEVREWVGDEQRIADLAREVDLLVTHVAPVTERVLSTARQLKFVGTPRGGPVNVNIPAATRAGVVVAHVPGRNARAVAEFTVGLMIAGPRQIAWSSACMREGRWTGELYRYSDVGPELAGRTIGLVGLGQVGSRVADLLRGFGVRLLGTDPYVDPDVAIERGVELVDLPTLLERSDIVSVHARLSAETRWMFGADAFARMRPGAYFVNTARGELVDEAALTAVLESGRLSGAALDVYAPEPPAADNPLLKMPQVVAVSHLAGASREVAHRAARRIAAEAGRFVRGERVVACANPEVVSHPR